MTEFHSCDFCGRSQKELLAAARRTSIEFSKDEDGLWVCSACQANLQSSSISQADEDSLGGDVLDERIKELIGKSAGAICRSADLPFLPPYRSIIEAAEKIAYDEDRYMSAWTFVTQWMDGTTVWQSEDRSAKAIVDAQGNVRIERNW